MPTESQRSSIFLDAYLLFVFLCCLTIVPAAAAQKIELRVGYQPFSSPTGAIFEVIKRDRILKQTLEQQKVALKFIPFKKGADSIVAFKRGELDAVAMGDMPLLEFALSCPVVIIAQNRQGYSTVVASRGTYPRDLKGKRIGNAFASSGHFTLLKILQNVGLTEKDVTLVSLDVNEMPDTLLKGKIDAFSVWEPTPSMFMAKYPERFSSVGRQIGSGYLAVSRPFFYRYPETVSLFGAGVVRAMEWLKKDRGNIQKAAAWSKTDISEYSGKPYQVSIEELGRQIEGDLKIIQFSARLPALKANGKNLLYEEFSFLKAIGRLPQDARWETLRNSFDHSVMERIYRNATFYSVKRFDYEL